MLISTVFNVIFWGFNRLFVTHRLVINNEEMTIIIIYY